MQLSRRDLLKVGLFSSAALMLPAERIARTQLAIANRIPQSQLPKPFTMDFKIPPRAVPVGQVGLTDYYVLRQEQRKVNILGDRQTTIWGYNGATPPKMNVEPRKYRFRVLNASVSRSFDLSLSTGEPLVVIGTDGGLMPQPQSCSHVKVGMAERYEIVIDFAKYKPGQQVVLKNSSPKNNIDYDTTNVICAFVVKDHVTDSRNNEVPRDLNPNMRVMGLTEKDAVATRTMRFERKNGHWTVNGQTWEDVVNSDYELTVANPKFGDVEIWELENPGGGWFHPVHIHLVDFKVLDRDGRAPEPYEQGPKDVVYVGESETVRVIMRFENQRGKYMMHCHNLVHEDHDMMVQFEVGDGGDDPIKADPCRSVSEMTDLLPARDNSGPGSGSTPGG